MKRLLAISILVFIVIGNAYAPDNLGLTGKWRSTVKLEVSNNDKDLINSTIKGYLLAELRKIPDISVVGEDEVFLISIVPLETDTHIILSICYLQRLQNSLIKHFLRNEEHWKTIDIMTRGYYELRNQTAQIFPKHMLEKKCQEIIIKFDADILQPGRESWEKYLKDLK